MLLNIRAALLTASCTLLTRLSGADQFPTALSETKGGGKLSRKELLSNMSPNSKRLLTTRKYEKCGTRYPLRTKVCPNKACGQEAINKAALKRADTLKKHLEIKLTSKKAFDKLLLAAQRLYNSKPSGARVAILAMKGGPTVESNLSIFGLGGGQRFVQSQSVQEAFVKAMEKEMGEERKGARRAEKEAAEQKPENVPRDGDRPLPTPDPSMV